MNANSPKASQKRLRSTHRDCAPCRCAANSCPVRTDPKSYDHDKKAELTTRKAEQLLYRASHLFVYWVSLKLFWFSYCLLKCLTLFGLVEMWQIQPDPDLRADGSPSRISRSCYKSEAPARKCPIYENLNAATEPSPVQDRSNRGGEEDLENLQEKG